MFLKFLPEFWGERDAVVSKRSGLSVLTADLQLHGVKEVDAGTLPYFGFSLFFRATEEHSASENALESL